MMTTSNVVQFPARPEPIIAADYFATETVPVNDLLSMLELLKQTQKAANDES
jgi:hypothetical protein